jgi:hypothetical protein
MLRLVTLVLAGAALGRAMMPRGGLAISARANRCPTDRYAARRCRMPRNCVDFKEIGFVLLKQAVSSCSASDSSILLPRAFVLRAHNAHSGQLLPNA